MDRTRPLGCIPTPEIKEARKHIHRILDPIWQEKRMGRKKLYAELERRLGYDYHTAEVRSVEAAREVYRAVQAIAREIAQ